MDLGSWSLGESSEAPWRLGFRPLGTEGERLALDSRALGVSLNHSHVFGVMSLESKKLIIYSFDFFPPNSEL